jgi:hypothetical protein
MAISAMHAALAEGPAPQRALLRAVAEVLVAQEREAGRIEVAVHNAASRPVAAPRPAELVQGLLGLPEPQLLITEFLAEHGGGPGSRDVFTGIAADMVCAATAEVFGDLVNDATAEFERLLLLAADGQIAAVALAGLEIPRSAWRLSYRAPRAADTDPAAFAALVRALDRMTRRHLRLATLLHGQAEAVLRIREHGRPRRFLARLHQRARELVNVPWLRTPDIRRADLETLEVALDALGEAIDTAADQLAGGEPVRAAGLLAGLRVPASAALPGRMYHQESLAQVRPLAAFGVWHRLALSRWAAAAAWTVEHGRQEAAQAAFAGAPETAPPETGGAA